MVVDVLDGGMVEVTILSDQLLPHPRLAYHVPCKKTDLLRNISSRLEVSMVMSHSIRSHLIW